MAPSDVHGQTAGAWKESEMARVPGGPLRRLPPGASNGAGRISVRREAGLKAPGPASPELHGVFPGQEGFESLQR